ncbi:hypothetical protein ACLOJK_040016 [Asimina triloba]
MRSASVHDRPKQLTYEEDSLAGVTTPLYTALPAYTSQPSRALEGLPDRDPKRTIPGMLAAPLPSLFFH